VFVGFGAPVETVLLGSTIDVEVCTTTVPVGVELLDVVVGGSVLMIVDDVEVELDELLLPPVPWILKPLDHAHLLGSDSRMILMP